MEYLDSALNSELVFRKRRIREYFRARQCAFAASSVRITCWVATVWVWTLSSFQVSSRVAHTSTEQYYIEKVYVEQSTHAANYIGTYVLYVFEKETNPKNAALIRWRRTKERKNMRIEARR